MKSTWQQDQLADARRSDFLRRLDETDLNLSGFEVDFIGTFFKYGAKFHWSDGRRQAVDKMIERYAAGLPAPRATTAAPPRPALPEAAPGRCDYLVRPEGGGPQQPCGEPAVEKTNLGAEYCQMHADLRREHAQKRRAIRDRRNR